jgi:hypothetical protein
METKVEPRFIKIDTCEKCPHLLSSRDYTADSWEEVSRWGCRITTAVDEKSGVKTERNIRRYVDWNDKVKFIPDWCPLPKS